MRVRVTGPNGTVLECGSDSALLPTEEGERAQAFSALSGALALLAGIKQSESSASKEDGTGSRCVETEQCHSDRKDGAVVHLAERRDARTRLTMLE